MFGTKKILAGAASGVVGGVVFGLMMAQMGTLPMIGRMIGVPTVAAGWLVHLGISATIGASFAVLLGWLAAGRVNGAVFGTAYGAVWWLLGPLTLMPLFMGMGLGVNWNPAAAQEMLPSLVGHVVFGVGLGLTYDLVRRRLEHRRSSVPRGYEGVQAAVEQG